MAIRLINDCLVAIMSERFFAFLFFIYVIQEKSESQRREKVSFSSSHFDHHILKDTKSVYKTSMCNKER